MYTAVDMQKSRSGKGMCAGALLGIAAFLLLAGTAFAEGRLVLNTFIDTRWQQDDNFYKAEDWERSVNTYVISPGFKLGWVMPKSRIELDYRMNIYDYDDKDPVPEVTETNTDVIDDQPVYQPSSEESYQEHIVNLGMNTNLTDRIMLKLDESFMRTRDPATSDPYNNSVDRSKYALNRITPFVYYAFGEKFGTGLKYRHTKTDYVRDELEDSDEHRGIFDLIYNLNRFTAVYAEGQFWTREYDFDRTPEGRQTSSEYESRQYSLNFQNQFKYFGFLGGVGFHNRTFDEPGFDDIDVVNWSIGMTGRNPSDLELPARSYVSVNFSRNFNDSGAGNQYYIASRLEAEAGYTFMERLKVGLEGYFQKSDYESIDPANKTDRDDNTWHMALNLDYRVMRMIEAGIEYGYETRDSNKDGYSYDNQYFSLHVKLDYDWGVK